MGPPREDLSWAPQILWAALVPIQRNTACVYDLKVHEHRQARNLHFLKEIGLENMSDFFT
jgi:hypothetical protein